MNLLDELFKLINNEKDIIPLLKTIEIKQKRMLIPFILEKRVKLHEQKTITKKTAFGTSYSSEYIHSLKKRDLIDKAAFVCITTKSDFQKHINARTILNDNYHKDILPWYTPKWLEDKLNTSWAWNYDLIIEYHRKGYCKVSDSIIASQLSNYITEGKWDKKNRTHLTTYYPDRIHKYAETLNVHIWLLFENNSSVNRSAKYNTFTNYSEKEDIWSFTFKSLINEGHIDRSIVIKKCIQTQEKELSRDVINWFYKLLLDLKPTKNELLEFQDELLITLNSEHSKVLSTSLRLLKTIAQDVNFNKDEMLSFSSMLLISNTKAIVNSTLMIFEKILKSNPDFVTQILISLCEVFINQDPKIQTRAAKIITKHANSDIQKIKSKLNETKDLFTYDARNLLVDFLEEEREEEEKEDDTQNNTLASIEQNELPTYDTFDAILFLLSQSLDNNEPYNLELSISLMPKFFSLINNENVSKLESFFKRAINHSFKLGGWNSRSGYLEVMYSNFINDLFDIVSKKYHSVFLSLTRYKKELIKEQYSNKWTIEIAQFRKQKIENQGLLSLIYTTHFNFLVKSKSLVVNNSTLPLLSQITHTPCWVKPETLLERLIKYEIENTTFNSYDLCTALLRLSHLNKNNELVELLNKIKNPRLKEIFNYLFDIQEVNQKEFKKK